MNEISDKKLGSYIRKSQIDRDKHLEKVKEFVDKRMEVKAIHAMRKAAKRVQGVDLAKAKIKGTDTGHPTCERCEGKGCWNCSYTGKIYKESSSEK